MELLCTLLGINKLIFTVYGFRYQFALTWIYGPSSENNLLAAHSITVTPYMVLSAEEWTLDHDARECMIIHDMKKDWHLNGSHFKDLIQLLNQKRRIVITSDCSPYVFFSPCLTGISQDFLAEIDMVHYLIEATDWQTVRYYHLRVVGLEAYVDQFEDTDSDDTCNSHKGKRHCTKKPKKG